MQLEVIASTTFHVDSRVRRLVAEAPDRHFGMLPGNVDFVNKLVPGILLYETEDGTEHFITMNSGTLVKCGDEVRVAASGNDLTELRARIETDFRQRNDVKREARAGPARGPHDSRPA